LPLSFCSSRRSLFGRTFFRRSSVTAALRAVRVAESNPDAREEMPRMP